jgi:acetamidase/formamidase
MGVAPPPDQQLETGRPLGVVSTGPPNINGGNMDNRHMCEGSTAFYPVFVPGALFSCGDGHAAQGDGEVSGRFCAIQTLTSKLCKEVA